MYIIKEKRSQNQCPNLPPEETSKLMIGNQQNRKLIEKINQIKSKFFEEINKICKPLSRCIR